MSYSYFWNSIKEEKASELKKTDEVTQWLKGLSAKPEDLDLIPWFHVAEGENQLPESVVCSLHMEHVHTDTHTCTLNDI